MGADAMPIVAADGSFSFSPLPNLSFAGTSAPAQYGPENSGYQLFNEGASYSGPAAAVHLAQISGISDLPLIPGVYTVSSFIEGDFIDVMQKLLQLQGVNPLAIFWYEYRQSGAGVFGSDSLGYEFEIIATAAAQSEVWDRPWRPELAPRISNADYNVWDIGWRAEAAQADATSATVINPSDILAAVVAVIILLIGGLTAIPGVGAVILAAVAALALSPGLRAGFSSIFSEVAQTTQQAITGSKGGGIIPSIGGALTMPIIATGAIVAGLVALLFVGEAKTGKEPDYSKLEAASTMFRSAAEAGSELPLNQAKTVKAIREAVT